jgi:hypothetical protein
MHQSKVVEIQTLLADILQDTGIRTKASGIGLRY